MNAVYVYNIPDMRDSACFHCEPDYEQGVFGVSELFVEPQIDSVDNRFGENLSPRGQMEQGAGTRFTCPFGECDVVADVSGEFSESPHGEVGF